MTWRCGFRPLWAWHEGTAWSCPSLACAEYRENSHDPATGHMIQLHTHMIHLQLTCSIYIITWSIYSSHDPATAHMIQLHTHMFHLQLTWSSYIITWSIHLLTWSIYVVTCSIHLLHSWTTIRPYHLSKGSFLVISYIKSRNYKQIPQPTVSSSSFLCSWSISLFRELWTDDWGGGSGGGWGTTGSGCYLPVGGFAVDLLSAVSGGEKVAASSTCRLCRVCVCAHMCMCILYSMITQDPMPWSNS